MKRYKCRIMNPVMGVPITFLGKYNPDKWELVGSSESGGNDMPIVKTIWLPKDRKNNTSGFIREGDKLKAVFKRLFIRRRIYEEV